jgi:hypothetical protein
MFFREYSFPGHLNVCMGAGREDNNPEYDRLARLYPDFGAFHAAIRRLPLQTWLDFC